MTTTNIQNRFKVLGVNDDRDFCECCGKQGLARVVWVEDIETGEIRHFGTTCAEKPQKGFGLGDGVKQAVKAWDKKVQAQYAKASALYRSKGGKWVSNGIPLHLKGAAAVVADKELYAECMLVVKQRE